MVAQAKAARPNVVNGINVDDLFALIDGVKRVPQAMIDVTNGNPSPVRALALFVLCAVAVWLLVTRRWGF